MTPSPTVLAVAVVLAGLEPALVEPGPVSGPPAPHAVDRGGRAELDGFASALDAAVRRVSRPSPVMLAARETARAYRLPGYGAFFVLAPRMLPAPPASSVAELSAARAVDEAIRHLEQGLRTASTPELRQQMDSSLQALRQTRAELQTPFRERAATVMVLKSPPTMVAHGAPDAGELRLEQLRRALESQMAEQIRALQAAESGTEPEQELVRRMEEQVHELQARMEAVRREVEEARMEAERQVEMRLAFPAPAGALPPPEAELVPDAPESAPPASVTVPAPPAPAAAPAPLAPVEPPFVAGPPPLPPAPWQYWFSLEEPADTRTEDALVRDVKEAVTALLERRGAALRLSPEEYVTVAVDFVPRAAMMGGRVQKTLVVKVKKHDLDERRAGRLGPAELRRHVEYAEY